MIARVVSLFLAGLLVAACEEEKAPVPVRPVISVRVSADATTVQSFVGTVEAREKAELSFQVIGRLLTRNVDAGDLVEPGDLIASVDGTTLALSVQAAEAALGNRRAERENAAATVARIDALRASGTAAEASLEKARTGFEAADAAVRQAEADLAKARDASGYAEIRASFPAVVTSVGAEPGQTVAPGQTVVTVARPDPRDAVIDVPDWIAGALTPGAAFVVALQIQPGEEIVGHLREIAPEADAVTRTRRLKIALDDAPSAFRLGTTVEVRLDARSNPAINLPETAILDRDGKSFVWVVKADESDPKVRREGTVALRAVVVAPVAAGSVRVVQGLEAGERVVMAGVHSLDDGEKVTVPADRRGGTL